MNVGEMINQLNNYEPSARLVVIVDSDIVGEEGYSFYPEVVKFDPNNTHQVFSAIKLSLEDDLLFYFNFERGVRNEVDKSVYENELFFVNFEKEMGRGKVLCLERKGAAVQFKKSPEFDTSKPFTITAWIKPDSIRGIHTIVSKGLVFSFKIRHGGLSFSGTGFQSVILDSLVLKQGSWQHVACVYVPDYHVQFFLNGQLIYDEAFRDLKAIEHALTIGNNFSNESFSGQLDELMIWNRALSYEEIEGVCSQRYRPANFLSTTGWIYLVGGFVVLLLYGVIRRKKKRVEKSELEGDGVSITSVQKTALERTTAEYNTRDDHHRIKSGSLEKIGTYMPGEKMSKLEHIEIYPFDKKI